MKRLTLYICSFLLISNLHAQSVQQKSIVARMARPNVSHGKLFSSIEGLDSAIVVYFRDRAESVKLYIKSKHLGQDFYDHFDASFIGDQYYFEKKYQQSMPALPKPEIDSISKMKGCEGDYQIIAKIDRDSIIYSFFQICPKEERQIAYSGRHAVNATYRGGDKELTRYLEAGFRSEIHRIGSDSVILLNGVVNPDGSISNLKLVESQSSAFGDFVKNRLEDTARSWLPTIQGGRPVRSVIRFYIGLNENKRLEVVTSP